MSETKRFVVTLKSPITLTVLRMDNTPLLLKTSVLLADWPTLDAEPREGPQVDLTIIRFATGDHEGSWFCYWKSEDGLTEPMSVQIKRDNILSRQEV